MTTRPASRSLLALAMFCAAILCAPAAGCKTMASPRIDSSGEGLVRWETKTLEYPGPPRYWNTAGLVISPARSVALVGTEVPMFAGICDGRGQLEPYEKVEWMLDQGGVGSLVSVSESIRPFCLELVSSKPHKIDNNYALTETLPANVILTRGTSDLNDDMVMPRGYTWVTVTSPVEGVSYVTAYGPDVYSWDVRQKSAKVHWIDAEWCFPQPGCAPPTCPVTLTTCVVRKTTKAPLSDWIVKYCISGGAEAGLGPDNAQSVEVATDNEGRANVLVTPPANATGTTCVNIELIRSECAVPSDPERLSIATAATHINWNSSQLTLRTVGPSQASVGSTATYRVEVSNAGQSAANDVSVTLQPPAGMALAQAEPAPESTSGPLVWRLGQVAAGEVKTISIDFRVEQAGLMNLCASLSAADGLTAESCATTSVGTVTTPPAEPPAQPAPTPPPVLPPVQPPAQAAAAARLELKLSGPQTAQLGSDIEFKLEVTNRGDGPAKGLTILDRFDAGLQHPKYASPIQRDFGDIEPGQSREIRVTFRVTRPGRLCHTMEVSGPGGLRESQQACVTVEAQARPEQPAMTVTMNCPKQARVGEAVDFTVEVANTGDIPAREVRITTTFDPVLRADQASAGVQRTADGGLTWTIDNLLPGARETRQVRCVSLAAAQRACGRVAVTDVSRLNLGNQACLEIAPAPVAPGRQSNLQVQISSRTNPAKVGSEVSYRIAVMNAGAEAERQVRLAVTVPEQMSFINSQGPTRPAVIDPPNVRFEPILELRSGETVNFELRLRANRPGAAKVGAEVSNPNTTQPLTAAETTNIFAE